MEFGIMDKTDLESYERTYIAHSRNYKSMHLIKTDKGVLLVKGNKKIYLTNREYLILRELLKM